MLLRRSARAILTCAERTHMPLLGGLICLSAMDHLIAVQCWGQEDLRVDVAVCRNAASSRSGLTFLPHSGLQGVVANR